MSKLAFGVELPFVVVEWDDAWKSSTLDLSLEEAQSGHKAVRTFTLGWVLIDDEKGIQLAGEASPKEALPFRQPSFIPRAMIVAVHPQKLSVPRKPKPGNPPHESQP